MMWSPPAKGIKLLNGINHTNGTWEGSRLSLNKPYKELAKDISSIIKYDIKIRVAFNETLSKKSLQSIKSTVDKYKENYNSKLSKNNEINLDR